VVRLHIVGAPHLRRQLEPRRYGSASTARA